MPNQYCNKPKRILRILSHGIILVDKIEKMCSVTNVRKGVGIV